MKSLLMLYWPDILAVLAVIIGIVLLIVFRKVPIVRRIIFSIVTEVEKELGSGTGVLKLAKAVELLYPKLPSVIKSLVSEKTIVKWIEEGLAEAKKKWESNASLLSKD